MSKESSSSSSGIGFFGLLQVCFIVLKITGHITWSWPMVFIPIYIWFVLVILVLVLAFIIGIIGSKW